MAAGRHVEFFVYAVFSLSNSRSNTDETKTNLAISSCNGMEVIGNVKIPNGGRPP